MSIETNFGRAYFDKMPTVAEAMVKVLRFFECSEIYGVPGDYAAPLVMALDEAFTLLPSSNELNAAYSACGRAELEGIGFCLCTYMVGSLPCLTAAALAKTERLAVVFISGAPGEVEGREEVLHHTLVRSDSWERCDDSALDAFRALGLRAERLTGQKNPHQANIAGEHFFRLLAHAFVHREPVLIEVPRDLLGTKTQTIHQAGRPEDLRPAGAEFSGLEDIVKHVTAKLEDARAPLIYFGEKVKTNPEVQKSILAFSRRFQIPFAANIYAKGVLDDHDPLSLGVYNGVFSADKTRRYVEQEVDLVIEIGTSTYAQDVSNALNTGTNVLATHPNKVAVIGSTPLEFDERAFLDAMLEVRLPPKEFAPPAPSPGGQVELGPALSLRTLFATLAAAAEDHEDPLVFLPEVGSSFFGSFHLPTRRSCLGRSWLANPWYGAMGTAIPYARAAARLIKERSAKDLAVVIIGDGGFQFQATELTHLMRDDLDCLIIYLANGVFEFGRCSDSPIYECVDPRFDPVKFVEAYGASGCEVDTPAAFDTALRAYLEQPDGVMLISALLSPDEGAGDDVLSIFNTYIQARAGLPEAERAWEALVGGAGTNEVDSTG
jgi:thiamine pyrophosphate-dependent acetolactate synthase large subunit-like protein